MSQENFKDTPSTSTESAERKLPWDLSEFSSSAQQINHLRMPIPSSAFVPTINAIASSQDLQWMVQPAVLGSVSGHGVPSHPYSRPITHTTHSEHARPGVIHAIGNTSWQRKRTQQLSPEEEEKQRLRRERNKLAAAKCRNRRRELTDLLQGETDRLEQEQASLHQQVDSLRDERARLELLLTTHSSVCKLPQKEPPCSGMYPADMPLSSSTAPLEVKREREEEAKEGALYHLKRKVLLETEDQYELKDAYSSQSATGYNFSYRFVDCPSSETDSSLSYTDELLNNSITKAQSTDNSRGSHYSDVRVLSSPSL
ncbi:fos-related antigen 2-like isoform X1 [Alosa pseudoharengus]|uniref:fos-related antigen 2-like isoform X1 n=2 Tax=Alosa pseudoharengus TaxID=34774 RepID=UPI003F895A56